MEVLRWRKRWKEKNAISSWWKIWWKIMKKNKNPDSDKVTSACKCSFYSGLLHGVTKACSRDDLLTAEDMIDIMIAESRIYMKYIHEDWKKRPGFSGYFFYTNIWIHVHMFICSYVHMYPLHFTALKFDNQTIYRWLASTNLWHARTRVSGLPPPQTSGSGNRDARIIRRTFTL